MRVSEHTHLKARPGRATNDIMVLSMYVLKSSISSLRLISRRPSGAATPRTRRESRQTKREHSPSERAIVPKKEVILAMGVLFVCVVLEKSPVC